MYTRDYSEEAPERDDVDAWTGPAVLEFGTNWCGYCRGAQPAIEEAMGEFPDVRHVKVEDGPGRRLGRSYRVKLWPTLIFLRDGRELARAVRPDDADDVRRGLRAVAATSE